MVDRRVRQQFQGIRGAGSVPRIQFSSSSAQVLQGFAQNMQRLTSEAQDELDQRTQVEATNQGQLDAIAGDPELQTYDTIRGRAYNKAAITTFATTLETRSAAKLAELESLYASEPEILRAEMDKYRKGTVQELAKLSPAAGAAIDQQIQLRSAPAVERAKDHRFKLTRDQAETNLISNEIAIEAELKSVAGDLMSDNPNLSEVAGQRVASIQAQVMSIYNATDANGKPLFSAKEKAVATQEFQEKIFTTATLSWFDKQDDPTKAYLDFTTGDFKLNLDRKGFDRGKLSGALNSAIDQAADRHGVDANAMATIAWIESKGKANAQNPRSSAGGPFQFIDGTAEQFGLQNRFDEFEASDAAARLMKANGKSLRQALGREPSVGEYYLAHQQGAEGARLLLANPNAPAAEIVGSDAVRLNGGKPGMTSQQFANIWISKGNRISNQVTTEKSIDVRKALDPSALAGIESEMRSRISFQNTMADRERVAEERAVTEEQEFEYFEMTDRLMASPAELEEQGLRPVTAEDIRTGVQTETLSPSQGRAMLKAVEVQAAKTTDPALEKELLQRMFNGEDIQLDIFASKGSLTPEDFKSLLTQNRTYNGSSDGEFSKPQKFYYDQLKSTLITSGMMEKFDPTAATRKSNALIEFKKRVEEGEEPEETMRDVLDRANRTQISILTGKRATMLTPRFSVPSPDDPQSVDIRSTGIKLNLALKAGQISKQSFSRQIKLLREWQMVQNEIARGPK